MELNKLRFPHGLKAGCLLVVAMVFLASAPARAQQQDAELAYRECMNLVEEDASAAYERASTWLDQGGGDPARHCAAVALIGLRRYGDAAQRLEDLGRKMQTESQQLRADALAQAAQAWMLAGDLQKAVAAQSDGLKLAPDNLELLIDRSIALASAANYGAALQDLEKAYKLAPERPDVLVYRATVHRYLDSPTQAMEDIQQAIRLAPDLPEAYLERGILRRLKNDQLGARQDWVKVLQLGADTPAATAARANLELLDVDFNAGLRQSEDKPLDLLSPLGPPTPLVPGNNGDSETGGIEAEDPASQEPKFPNPVTPQLESSGPLSAQPQ